MMSLVYAVRRLVHRQWGAAARKGSEKLRERRRDKRRRKHSEPLSRILVNAANAACCVVLISSPLLAMWSAAAWCRLTLRLRRAA